MVPSSKWFPGALSERAMWAQNFGLRFGQVAAGLGFTPAEVTSAQNDMIVLQDLASIDYLLKNSADAMRQYRVIVTEGGIGDPNPVLPSSLSFSLSATVPTGIFERLSDLRDRILAAPPYTGEIGAELGIVNDAAPQPPAQLKPVIGVEPEVSDYKFSVKVTRMGMQAFKVMICRANSDTWTEAGFGTSSPLTVTVAPTTPGQTERLLVRVILIDKNQPVGVPSDPTFVTVNP